MKRIIMIILCLVWWSNTVSAQCYTKMMDASGIAVSASDLQMLEDSACALKAILPQAVRDSFSIVDFGFYAQNENMVGGYPEFMDLMIQELAADPKSKYYILFARESSSKGGPNSKIWVKVKLPTWGQFSCTSSTLKNLTIGKLQKKIENTFTENLSKTNCSMLSELAGIRFLKKEISNWVNCCDPNRNTLCNLCFSKTEINDVINDLNFYIIKDIKIVELELLDKQTSGFNEFSKVTVELLDGNKQDFRNIIEHSLSKLGINDYKIIITSDINTCKGTSTASVNRSNGNQNSFEDAKDIFDSDQSAKMLFWFHVSKDLNTIWFKSNNPNDPIIVPTNCETEFINYDPNNPCADPKMIEEHRIEIIFRRDVALNELDFNNFDVTETYTELTLRNKQIWMGQNFIFYNKNLKYVENVFYAPSRKRLLDKGYVDVPISLTGSKKIIDPRPVYYPLRAAPNTKCYQPIWENEKLDFTFNPTDPYKGVIPNATFEPSDEFEKFTESAKFLMNASGKPELVQRYFYELPDQIDKAFTYFGPLLGKLTEKAKGAEYVMYIIDVGQYVIHQKLDETGRFVFRVLCKRKTTY